MRRDNAGTVTGDGTLRYGWADAQGSACEVAAQVARVLCDRGWRGAPRSCGTTCSLPSVIAKDICPPNRCSILRDHERPGIWAVPEALAHWAPVPVHASCDPATDHDEENPR
jgi:hypothetical protein